MVFSKKTNDLAARDYNAETLQRSLRDFQAPFAALSPPKQSEALQCVLKRVVVHPKKLELEAFEIAEFWSGSQNRREWLPGQDSNLQHFG
jgi:hypothetical protein